MHVRNALVVQIHENEAPFDSCFPSACTSDAKAVAFVLFAPKILGEKPSLAQKPSVVGQYIR